MPNSDMSYGVFTSQLQAEPNGEGCEEDLHCYSCEKHYYESHFESRIIKITKKNVLCSNHCLLENVKTFVI